MSGPERIVDLLFTALRAELEGQAATPVPDAVGDPDGDARDATEAAGTTPPDPETDPGPDLSALTPPILLADVPRRGDPALQLSELTPPQLTFADRFGDSTAPSPAFMETLIVLNAAMLPGWPYPSAMVRDTAALPLPLKPAAEAMTEAERAEYLAALIGPYREALSRLRRVLKEIEQLDPKDAEALVQRLMQALATVARAVLSALDLSEAGRRATEDLSLASQSPGGPASRRHRYRL